MSDKDASTLRAEIARFKADRLAAEADLAQTHADQAQADADRIRRQFTAAAPGR